MKVKNISNKIIGFGKVSILPEETAVVDDNIKDNEVAKSLKALNFIEFTEDAPVKKETPKKNAKKEDAKPDDAADSDKNAE